MTRKECIALLAREFGLNESDLRGIVRAAIARDGAGKRVTELQRAVERETARSNQLEAALRSVRLIADPSQFVSSDEIPF